jgi:predicted RNA binding protein YcfA (HicA-like mRNA interferase family)
VNVDYSNADLERAGFVNRGGKGSHRNFVHPKLAKPITISGRPGDDATSGRDFATKMQNVA